MPAISDKPAAADRLLQRQIAHQLAQTRRLALARLAVDVHDGYVTLHGRVESFYEKQIAIHACRLLAEAKRLVDAIEVSPRR